MPPLRLLLPLLIVSFFVLTPVTTFAADANFFGPIINEECKCPDSAPDWGCVLQTVQNVINLGISLGVIFFVLVFSYAGVLLMASATNPENKKKAKNMLLTTVIGFMIVLSAWLLVDFVMKAVYNEGSFGPWNSILAENSTRTCILKQAAPPGPGTAPDTTIEGGFSVGAEVECDRGGSGTYYPGTINGISEDEDGTNPRVSVSYDDGESENLIPASRCRLVEEAPTTGDPDPSADGQFTYDSYRDSQGRQVNIRDQQAHASAALNSLLSCMADRVPANVGRISGISDSLIVFGERTFPQCADRQRTVSCKHARNSCHYGGEGQCNGKSYAVDFGDEENEASLRAAARACGVSNSSIINEGDHIHISVGLANGCECN